MDINGINVTLDDLQNGYYIYQSADGFRFGVDAVFLSNFANIKPGEKVLDLGTGNAIIPILLAAKTRGEHFYGLEIQRISVMLAKKSVEYNKLQERISIVEGDICRASEIFGYGKMDAVVSNPPYMIGGHGLPNETDAKFIARHEALCSFDDIAREASKVLRTRGRLYLIHRPFRLTELILTLTRYKLEPKRIKFVHPYADASPTMVMIEAMKEGGRGVKIEEPLILQAR